jgi:hypothetical protein
MVLWTQRGQVREESEVFLRSSKLSLSLACLIVEFTFSWRDRSQKETSQQPRWFEAMKKRMAELVCSTLRWPCAGPPLSSVLGEPWPRATEPTGWFVGMCAYHTVMTVMKGASQTVHQFKEWKWWTTKGRWYCEKWHKIECFPHHTII